MTDKELGPVIFSGAGLWLQVTRVRKWLERGRRGRMPSMSGAHVMVIVLRDWQIEEWECKDGRLVRVVVGRSYHAIGSGCDEARGAMYVGASPRRAVLAAASNDRATGDGVDVVRFKKSSRATDPR